MIPGISKFRQAVWFLAIFVALVSLGRVTQPKQPEHAFFEGPELRCHPVRRLTHETKVSGGLQWKSPLFEPEAAKEEILLTLLNFHKSHKPTLRPIEGWPQVAITDLERDGEHYLVSWRATYKVHSCGRLDEGEALHKLEEMPTLVATFTKK